MNSKHFPVEPVRIMAFKPGDFPVRMLQSASMGVFPTFQAHYIRDYLCSGDDCPVCKEFE